MFHTNKMPKIIVFRVVIEGTAPTEGPPTACHGKRPSCPKRAQRPPSHPAPNTSACIQLPHLRKPFSGAYLRPSAYPATGNALPVPSTPSARLLIQPRTRAPASSFHTCESHFRAHICARLPIQPQETPFLSQAPRAPAFSSSPERPSVRIQLRHL